MEAAEGFWDFKIGGQVICTMKYAADFMQMSMEEAVLQGTIDRLNENEICHTMNVENTKVMRISIFPVQIMPD